MSRRNLALLALAALALLWGYNWVVMKIAVHYAGPFAFAAWRTLGGAVVLFLVGVVLRKPLRPQFPAFFAVVGLFQTAAFLGLVTWAIVASGVGQTAMLAYTMPFWVAILGWPLLNERLHLTQSLAIVIALVGVACMIGRLDSWFGDALALAAGACWAVATIVIKRFGKRERVDLFNMTAWQMLLGGIALVVVSLFVHEAPTVWTPVYVGALAYNVIAATAIAYLLWLFVLDALPARDASMGTLANPIIGAVAAWIQLGERPPLLETAGMILVAIGLVVLSLADRFALPPREQQRVANDEQA